MLDVRWMKSEPESISSKFHSQFLLSNPTYRIFEKCSNCSLQKRVAVDSCGSFVRGKLNEGNRYSG